MEIEALCLYCFPNSPCNYILFFLFVSGAGAIKDVWDDIREIIRESPDAYEDAIESVTDMMCTAAGNC